MRSTAHPLTILALDTTSEFGGVALRGDQIVSERVLHSPDGFAHILFQAISELLRTAGVEREEIDIFAAASGPGSFTGVRIGLAAVKGLAAAEGKRAYGISTLRALCCFATGDDRAAILDARRGEVFAGIYNRNLHAVVPEMVGPLPPWLASLSASVDEFVIFAGSPFASALQGHRCTEAPRNLANAVGLCAARHSGRPLLGTLLRSMPTTCGAPMPSCWRAVKFRTSGTFQRFLLVLRLCVRCAKCPILRPKSTYLRYTWSVCSTKLRSRVS